MILSGKRFLTETVLTLVVCCLFHYGVLLGNDSTPNPFLQLMNAMNMPDSADSFDLVEESLSQITPADCEINDIKFSKDEMEYILLLWKLELSTSFKHAEKANVYLNQLEKILDNPTIDFDSVSAKFTAATSDCFHVELKRMAVFDRFYAYILTARITDAQINEIQEMIKKEEKGSLDYYKNKQLLGLAYCKTQRQELAIKPLEECFEYFIDKNPYEAMLCAVSLQGCYMLINKPEEVEKYKKIVEELNQDAEMTLVEVEQDVMTLLKMWGSDAVNKKTKSAFLELKNKILEKSNSDLQLWITYVVSALVGSENSDLFPQEDVLSDLEKAFAYQDLIWDDTIENDAIIFLNGELHDMKNKMLKSFADSKQYEKLNYWVARFERNDQREASLDAMLDAIDYDGASSLSSSFSKYEEAIQIIRLEEAKALEKRDKKMLQRAQQIKQELEHDFDAMRKKLSANDTAIFESVLSDIFTIPPDSMGQLSSILPQDVACIQYLLLDDCIVTYVVLHDAPPFSSITTLKSIGETLRSFKNRLVRIRSMLQNPDQEETAQKEMQWLYKVLFSKLKKPFSGKKINRLVINPSGMLRYIPFAALYDGERYMIEKYQITSITGMDLIRIARETKPQNLENLSISVFADPDGSLPSAKKEGEQIADLFVKKNIFVGQSASIREFQALAGNMNFVHLATHAVLDSKNPAKSYVSFANGEKLYYSDMMGFNIKDVDVIALSACSTAMTEKSTGGEIQGMAYQLLRKSPSGSILASLWKVDDQATSALMCGFYKHIVNNVKEKHTLDRGGALREAQLSLLHDPKTSAPFYWASFTLFGDFR